jgi:hypothetical protein
MMEWTGPLRGFQKRYNIGVLWGSASDAKPYVFLINPALRARENEDFSQIPHLIFYNEHPQLSGLCLFDPAGREWSNRDLIADTTLPWAAEWLLYYELWHVDGVWRGGGVGPESVAEARATTLYRQAAQLTPDAA